jgi:hypothetical protein
LAGAKSLIATKSSSPPLSNKILVTALPIRPNPLIATFVAILISFFA